MLQLIFNLQIKKCKTKTIRFTHTTYIHTYIYMYLLTIMIDTVLRHSYNFPFLKHKWRQKLCVFQIEETTTSNGKIFTRHNLVCIILVYMQNTHIHTLLKLNDANFRIQQHNLFGSITHALIYSLILSFHVQLHFVDIVFCAKYDDVSRNLFSFSNKKGQWPKV